MVRYPQTTGTMMKYTLFVVALAVTLLTNSIGQACPSASRGAPLMARTVRAILAPVKIVRSVQLPRLRAVQTVSYPAPQVLYPAPRVVEQDCPTVSPIVQTKVITETTIIKPATATTTTVYPKPKLQLVLVQPPPVTLTKYTPATSTTYRTQTSSTAATGNCPGGNCPPQTVQSTYTRRQQWR